MPLEDEIGRSRKYSFGQPNDVRGRSPEYVPRPRDSLFLTTQQEQMISAFLLRLRRLLLGYHRAYRHKSAWYVDSRLMPRWIVHERASRIKVHL